MADTTTYLSGNRIQGRSDDTLLTTISQTSWKQLDKVTLGSAGADLDTGTFAAKDNLMILAHLIPSTTCACDLTFNADSLGNYATRRSNNGSTDSTSTSDSLVDLRYNSNEETFIVINIRNIANKEKLCIANLATISSGAGTPNRAEVVFKWANTSDQITRVNFNKGSSFVNYASGSEVVVLGCDDDEADSGTNFFEELTYKALTSSGELRTDTFTAKDYILVQVLTKISTSTASWGFNDDLSSSSGNYGGGGSANGGSAYNSSSTHSWFMGNADHTTWEYVSAYIVNKPTKNKLGLQFKTYGATGSGTAPSRIDFVGNWNNTSDQITRIKITRNDSASLTCDADSNIRVWGGTPT